MVLVPMFIVLLASRIRTAALESTQAALTHAVQQHERARAELTHSFERAVAEFTRLNERAMADYGRQHQTALAELAAEHKRIAQEFGMFSQKRHEVYARLYARYRAAIRDFAALLTGKEPDFQKFTRDDLLRYVQRRQIRARDAADAIAAMDRGDVFAMNKLMTRLHWRVSLRDATAAFERAREFEALNELYLSESVAETAGNVRRKLEALAFALGRDSERGDQAGRLAKQDELQSAVASLLHVMRDDLRAGDDRPRPRTESDRVVLTHALPARGVVADKQVALPSAGAMMGRAQQSS